MNRNRKKNQSADQFLQQLQQQQFLFESQLFESDNYSNVNWNSMKSYVIKSYYDEFLWHKYCRLNNHFPDHNTNFAELLIDWTEFLCIDYLRVKHRMIDSDAEEFMSTNHSLEFLLDIIQKVTKPNVLQKTFDY